MYVTDGRPVPPVCESRKPGMVLPGELRDERKTLASRSPRPRRAGPPDAGRDLGHILAARGMGGSFPVVERDTPPGISARNGERSLS